MEEKHHLLRPLLNPSSSISAAAQPLDDDVLNNVTSNSGIIFRLSMVVFIGLISIWANHEASKGYAITILNDSGNTLADRRFHLFYVSNDEATRIVIKASNTIENFLYPDYNSVTFKKQITRVIIQLVDRNLAENVVVGSGLNQEFVISISSSILEGKNFGHNMNLALVQGVARMWLWDIGQGQTPKSSLIDGIVEYLVNNLFGLSVASRAEPRESVKQTDSSVVAELLNQCECRRPGFIRRLNQAMKDGALGRSVHDLCTTYEPLRYNSLSE